MQLARNFALIQWMFNRNNMKSFLKVVLFAALSVSTSVSAGFVHLDWKVAGDGKATLHQETGIEWLKLPNTNKKSINEVISELATTYAGWRMPTNTEVEVMIQAIWGPALNVAIGALEARGGSYLDGAYRFSNMMGNSNYSTSMNLGMYIDEDNMVTRTGSYTNGTSYSWVYGLEYIQSNSQDLKFNTPYFPTDVFGVFLVSDGGVTLSSINDPTINANNPAAPVNTVTVPPIEPVNNVTPVNNVPVGGLLFGLMGAFLLSIRRRAVI
jgi:hypothetical protein